MGQWGQASEWGAVAPWPHRTALVKTRATYAHR